MKNDGFEKIAPKRLEQLQQAVCVCVGETSTRVIYIRQYWEMFPQFLIISGFTWCYCLLYFHGKNPSSP